MDGNGIPNYYYGSYYYGKEVVHRDSYGRQILAQQQIGVRPLHEGLENTQQHAFATRANLGDHSQVFASRPSLGGPESVYDIELGSQQQMFGLRPMYRGSESNYQSVSGPRPLHRVQSQFSSRILLGSPQSTQSQSFVYGDSEPQQLFGFQPMNRGSQSGQQEAEQPTIVSGPLFGGQEHNQQYQASRHHLLHGDFTGTQQLFVPSHGSLENDYNTRNFGHSYRLTTPEQTTSNFRPNQFFASINTPSWDLSHNSRGSDGQQQGTSDGNIMHGRSDCGNLNMAGGACVNKENVIDNSLNIERNKLKRRIKKYYEDSAPSLFDEQSAAFDKDDWLNVWYNISDGLKVFQAEMHCPVCFKKLTPINRTKDAGQVPNWALFAIQRHVDAFHAEFKIRRDKSRSNKERPSMNDENTSTNEKPLAADDALKIEKNLLADKVEAPLKEEITIEEKDQLGDEHELHTEQLSENKVSEDEEINSLLDPKKGNKKSRKRRRRMQSSDSSSSSSSSSFSSSSLSSTSSSDSEADSSKRRKKGRKDQNRKRSESSAISKHGAILMKKTMKASAVKGNATESSLEKRGRRGSRRKKFGPGDQRGYQAVVTHLGDSSFKNLMDRSVKDILASFSYHEAKLKLIYGQSMKQLKRNYKPSDLPDMIHIDIMNEEQLSRMAELAEMKLAKQDRYNSSDVIFDAVLPEWALAEFCRVFCCTRTEAVQILRNQNRTMIERSGEKELFLPH